jgi:hypothetical protein
MRSTLFLLLATGFAVASTGAQAGPLDGSYISNKNNHLEISGSRYIYIPRDGTTNPKNVRSSGTFTSLGDSRYKFSGYLKYTCTHSGNSLDCGKRIWTRR